MKVVYKMRRKPLNQTSEKNVMLCKQARISSNIRPCHTAAILSRETKKALFYNAKPHPHGFHCEAWRGKTKLFWSPGTIWPPCDKG